MSDESAHAERRHTAAALMRHKKSAEDMRNEPLAFWDLNLIAASPCICCDQEMSHVSAYPFHSSEKFARQIILWCELCGFGMVPGTSFPLDDYYRTQYAIENRRDRDLDPESYFAKMESDNPPKNLARYIGRARNQIRKIRKYVPEIGSMLDVGAGPGYALWASGAKQKFAIEYDDFSRKYLDYIDATIVDWDAVPRHRYDVVLLSHSLEHFQFTEVLTRLELLMNSVNPGGLLYIEVPPGGLGWKQYHYKHEPHTLFFTPEALQGLAQKLNGEILLCAPTLKTYNLISDIENPIYEGRKGQRLGNPRGRLTLILKKGS